MVTHTKRLRLRRKARIQIKIRGTNVRPRVSVFRSNRNMYVQFIDDNARETILGMYDKSVVPQEKNKRVRAKELGKKIAAIAKKKKISRVVFDRGGYLYHGRVEALAQGLREGGLVF